MIAILLFLLINLSQATDELYTIYADGSIQYYSFNTCYRKFFPSADTTNNITTVTHTYIIVQQTDKSNNTKYYEYYYQDTQCGNYNHSTEVKVGVNCGNCQYNKTQLRDTKTFAMLTFSPQEMGRCGNNKNPGERYVSNVFLNQNMGKCINGILMGFPMSFHTELKVDNGKTVVHRSRYNGFGCKDKKFETVVAECGKCTLVKCEITAWTTSVCDDTQANGTSSIIILSLLLLLLLLI